MIETFRMCTLKSTIFQGQSDCRLTMKASHPSPVKHKLMLMNDEVKVCQKQAFKLPERTDLGNQVVQSMAKRRGVG